jgi:hypothetical protein
MTLRTIITAILILFSIPVLIVWKYCEVYNIDFEFNDWIYSGFDYPLNIQWVVKFAGIHVRDMCISFAVYRMTNKIKTLRIVAAINLAYSVIDTALFAWSFNRGKDVLLVHGTLTVVVSLVILYRKDLVHALKQRSSNKHTVNYNVRKTAH